ncbi:MAG: pilus assembly protein PilM [Halanaerobiales bacterium]
MFAIFGSGRPLGIDFGEKIKIAEYTKNSFREETVEHLDRKALKKFSGRDAVTAVAGEKINIKFIEIANKMTGDEISRLVELEFNNENLVVQQEIVSEFPQKFVIGMGIDREIIEDILNRCRSLGLRLQAVETEFHANVRYLFHHYPALGENIILIIDIGRNHTNLTVTRNREVGFIRVLNTGGRQMTEKLASIEDISFHSAEEEKKLGPGDEKVRILLEDLKNQIYHSIDYFQSEYRAEIEQIFLTGGGALLEGIEGYLEDTIGINTRKVHEPLSSVSRGLALREN